MSIAGHIDTLWQLRSCNGLNFLLEVASSNINPDQIKMNPTLSFGGQSVLRNLSKDTGTVAVTSIYIRVLYHWVMCHVWCLQPDSSVQAARATAGVNLYNDIHYNYNYNAIFNIPTKKTV